MAVRSTCDPVTGGEAAEFTAALLLLALALAGAMMGLLMLLAWISDRL